MSIKIKILLNALITIICVIGVGATGLIYTNRVADVSLALFDTQALPILKINEVDKTAQAVFSRLILHTTTSEGEVMEQVEGEIADLNAQLQKQIGEYQQIASAGDNQADAGSANAWVAQFNDKWEEFNAFSTEILEMSQNFIKEDALAMMVGEEKKSYVEAMALLQARIGNHRTMMTAFRDEAVASSENSQVMIATFIGAALLIALIVAFLLGRSIVSPIMLGVDVARRISKGDLSKSIDIRRSDEIGVLANALREMQENIQGVLQTFNGVVKDIEMGKIRNRGDSGKYQGAFAELLEGGNKIADVLVHYIDLSPGIVLAMDTEYNVMFMNKKGLDLLDVGMDDVVGRKCHDLMKSSDCKNGNCACAKAMKTLAQERSETDSHPGGHDLEIEYVGVPIIDSTGKAVGVFEFVVDQTVAKQAQKKMENLADQASHISEQLASSTEELTAQVDQSSQGAELQRERAAETATAMEQMNSTVIEVAKNATEAASNADQTKQKATDGAEIVNQVIASINQVHDLAQELNANMQNLGKQAEGIGQIMNVISDIADQTNLLALNAAIEAARAGDAGRGFAVVADEVRKLAEKTMSATTEVGSAIGAIQEVTKKNIKATEMAVEAVSTSTELSSKSGRELNEIVTMAEGTSDQVRAIATASEEQSATAEHISRSADEINRISSETSEAMNQSAKAITELSHLAQSLDRLIQEMQS